MSPRGRRQGHTLELTGPGQALTPLGKISHLTCEYKGLMQGITPEPAGS